MKEELMMVEGVQINIERVVNGYIVTLNDKEGGSLFGSRDKLFNPEVAKNHNEVIEIVKTRLKTIDELTKQKEEKRKEKEQQLRKDLNEEDEEDD